MDTLKQMTGRLASTFLPVAVRNHSFFMNDIPEDLPVEHNKEWVSSIISGLLGAVVMHAKETCIRLTARKYGHVVVLEIKESGCISTYAMACGLQDVQSLAEKIGGCLTININKEKTTTIAFSFPNLPIAA
jgi:glucose-6-phosphate-specific signal transduction histidine kinase